MNILSKMAPFGSFAFINSFIIFVAGQISKDVNLVRFVYYGSPNPNSPGVEINLNGNKNPVFGGIKRNAPTTLIIDGFLSNGQTPMSQTTKNALTRNRPLENAIIVDWGSLSGSGSVMSNLIKTSQTYAIVLGNVGPVGRRVAEFIIFLQRHYGITPSQVHIVGHSLGAHVAGAAGYWVQTQFNSKIGRITGLDPAGPLFTGVGNVNRRLDKGDADFVDIYHTNRASLGDKDHKTGDINVYVNGGNEQPSCAREEKKAICSHSYSWRIFDASYDRDIIACPCSGVQCQCGANCRVNCSGGLKIGANVPISARGAFHVVSMESFQ